MPNRPARTAAPTAFHQVLIILFGALFFKGGAGDPIADRVKDAVEDDARRPAAVAAAEALDASLKRDAAEVIRWHEGFYALIGTAEATADDVRANVDEFIATLEGLEREQIDLRRALAESLEPSEWGEVFD